MTTETPTELGPAVGQPSARPKAPAGANTGRYFIRGLLAGALKG